MTGQSDRGRRIGRWWRTRPPWLRTVLSVLWLLIALGVVIGLALWLVMTARLLVTGTP